MESARPSDHIRPSAIGKYHMPNQVRHLFLQNFEYVDTIRDAPGFAAEAKSADGHGVDRQYAARFTFSA
jgi:hypothetical protein